MRRSTAGEDADDEDLIVVDMAGHGMIIAQAQPVHAAAAADERNVSAANNLKIHFVLIPIEPYNIRTHEPTTGKWERGWREE